MATFIYQSSNARLPVMKNRVLKKIIKQLGIKETLLNPQSARRLTISYPTEAKRILNIR